MCFQPHHTFMALPHVLEPPPLHPEMHVQAIVHVFFYLFIYLSFIYSICFLL
jgi:hypothetical protein